MNAMKSRVGRVDVCIILVEMCVMWLCVCLCQDNAILLLPVSTKIYTVRSLETSSLNIEGQFFALQNISDYSILKQNKLTLINKIAFLNSYFPAL